VDISAVSLRLAIERAAGRAEVVQADARQLPFPDDVADIVLATGSLHHTGDAAAAFVELTRVLRPGGLAFVAVYSRGGYYRQLYGTVGRVARSCQRHRVTETVVNRCLILPAFGLYFIAGRTLTQRRLTMPSRRQLRNYFADQLLNPVVTFHTADELRTWAAGGGLDVVSESESHAGALLQMVVAKPAPAECNRADDTRDQQ
jgi:SAM-dependent methyltransferase